jgi:hypothetical protein
MIFLTIVGVAGTIKTYGNNELEYLIEVALREMPIGYTYRIVSKNMILRLEFLSLDPYVLTFTNLEKSKHTYLLRKVMDRIDQDELESEDDETTIDLT